MVNLEFRKNLWSEFTITRLIITPLIIVIVYLMVFLTSDVLTEYMESIRMWSLIMIYIIVFLWGTRLASESIITEVNRKTWINQRITSIGAWEMSIGKLFGSTIYNWYGASFCIIGYIIASFYLPNIVRELKFLLIIILVGIFCHAVTIAVSLIGIRNNKSNARINSTVYFIFGMIVSGATIYYAYQIHHSETTNLHWFMFKLNYSDFSIGTVVFFTGWAIMGLYRGIRAELMMTNGFLTWILFLVSLMLYFSGIISNINALNLSEIALVDLYISIGIAVLFCYFMMFSEPRSIANYRLFLSEFKKRNWHEIKLLLPLWSINLMFILLICIGMIVFALVSEKLSFINSFVHYLLPVNILLFVLRDICILLYISMSEKSRRSNLTAAVCLLILYLLLPTLFSLMGLSKFSTIFLPARMSKFWLGTLPVLLQFSVIFFLLFRRLKLINKMYQE